MHREENTSLTCYCSTRDIHAQLCMSLHPTVTMATQALISPLLTPRPDFLGVRVSRRRELNLFQELAKLSLIGPTSLTKGSNQGLDTGADEDMLTVSENPPASYTKDGEDKLNNSLSVLEHKPDGQTRKILYKVDQNSIKLFQVLDSLNIDYTTEIYQPKEHRLNVTTDVLYCKNLFLKDRKGDFYLVIIHEDIQTDLKYLRKAVKAHRNFSFGTEHDLAALLGVEPGAVTPLALMNTTAQHVKMVVSKSLLIEGASVMFHPLDAALATQMTLEDLLRFLDYFNHSVIFVD